MALVSEVSIPAGSRLNGFFDRTELSDAFAAPVPANVVRDPETLARFVMRHQAPWVTALVRVRDAVVSLFGLKQTGDLLEAGRGDTERHLHFFTITDRAPEEIVMGVDDRHLDFRLSVWLEQPDPTGESGRVILATVVKCHNALGRAYLAVIAPFHRRVVRSGLARAARAGWPTVDEPVSGRDAVAANEEAH